MTEPASPGSVSERSAYVKNSQTIRAILVAILPVMGVLWLLDAPQKLGWVIITEQYLAVICGLACLVGLRSRKRLCVHSPPLTRTISSSNSTLATLSGLCGVDPCCNRRPQTSLN